MWASIRHRRANPYCCSALPDRALLRLYAAKILMNNRLGAAKETDPILLKFISLIRSCFLHFASIELLLFVAYFSKWNIGYVKNPFRLTNALIGE